MDALIYKITNLDRYTWIFWERRSNRSCSRFIRKMRQPDKEFSTCNEILLY